MDSKLKKILLTILYVILFIWAIICVFFRVPRKVSIALLIVGSALLIYTIITERKDKSKRENKVDEETHDESANGDEYDTL
jgi:hypothetical protein